MDMQTFISSFPDRLETVADKAGTKPIYLRQIARGYRKASHVLARRIESATSGYVTVHDLRSDIFGPAPGVAPEHQEQAA